MSSSDLAKTARATVNNLKALFAAAGDNPTARQLRAVDCVDSDEAYQQLLDCALSVEYYDERSKEWYEYGESIDLGKKARITRARIWLTMGGPDLWIEGPIVGPGEFAMYGCWYSEERIVSQSWICRAVASYVL